MEKLAERRYNQAMVADSGGEFAPPGPVKLAAERVKLERLKGEEAQKFDQAFPDAKVRGRDVWAARKGKEFAGGIVIKSEPDEYTKGIIEKHAPGRASKGHVSFFYVNPSQRGQGVGSELLAKAIAGRGDVSLDTDNRRVDTNEAAVHLYEKAGFEPLKREKKSTYWLRKQAQYRMIILRLKRGVG